MSASTAAATAALWLARLPASQRAAAHAATDLRLAGWAASAILGALVCWLLARSGLMSALRRSVEAERRRPWIASGALGGLLVLALALVHAPSAAYFAWRRAATLAAGGGAPPAADFGAYLGQALAGVAPAVLAALLVIPPLYATMRRAPRTWPAVVGGAAVLLALVAGWLPYALALAPTAGLAPPSPARGGVARLAAEIGLPTSQVWLSADPAFDADVEGAFGHARIVVGPTLLAASPAEARAFVGHVAGHYVHCDVFWACLIYGAVLVAGFFAVQRWAAPVAAALRRLPRFTGEEHLLLTLAEGEGDHSREADMVEGAQGGGPEDRELSTLADTKHSAADPEAMPGAALILLVAVACAGLAASAYLRWANVRADAFSLRHAREPKGLATVIEREWDHASVDPSFAERALFYTHPPLASRLRRIAAWAADHPALSR